MVFRTDCIGFNPRLLDEVILMKGNINQYSITELDQEEIEIYTITSGSNQLLVSTLAFGDSIRYLEIQHHSLPNLIYQGILMD